MLWVMDEYKEELINLEQVTSLNIIDHVWMDDKDFCVYADFGIKGEDCSVLARYKDEQSASIALDILARRMAKANTLFVQMPTQEEVDAQIARQPHD